MSVLDRLRQHLDRREAELRVRVEDLLRPFGLAVPWEAPNLTDFLETLPPDLRQMAETVLARFEELLHQQRALRAAGQVLDAPTIRPADDRPACINCSRGPAFRRRLCSTCYRTPAIRQQHQRVIEAQQKVVVPRARRGRVPARATDARPGTPEKLAVMMARLAAGECLFHKDDPRWEDALADLPDLLVEDPAVGAEGRPKRMKRRIRSVREPRRRRVSAC